MKLQTPLFAVMAVTTLTFSFCCDLMALSFFCSLLSLASSSSCCLAAIAASSFTTSSCWARHCCSYKRTYKYTPERNKKKQVIGHHQLSWKNLLLRGDQLSHAAKVPEVLRLPFKLLCSMAAGPIKPLNHSGNLQVPCYKRRMLEIGIAHSLKNQGKKSSFGLLMQPTLEKNMIWISKFAKLKRIIMH